MNIRFIDLFAGIGGFRYGLEKTKGYECVYSNEWDKYATQIYDSHFKHPSTLDENGGDESDSSRSDGERWGSRTDGVDTRDIRTVPSSEIPDFDLLVGGFPCQAFSIAGKRAGFNDTRGTLFFEIARILRDKRPRYFILENVKGLLSHDEGKTLQTIFGVLSDLGYEFQWQVLNSKNFGVPQNRERIFIVGNLRGERRPKVFPVSGTSEEDNRNTGEDLSYALDANYHKGTNTLSKGRRQLIQKIGGSQGMRVYDPEGLSTTIAGLAGGWGAKTGLYAMQWRRTEKGKAERRKNQANGRDYTPFSDGAREVVPNPDKKVIGTITSQAVAKDSLVGNETQIRRLTPVECERLQGFPDGWTEGISDTQRYKCLGNAVTTNVVEWIGRQLIKSI
jgi:DNA (cytosine-5)-methyltransferase 1